MDELATTVLVVLTWQDDLEQGKDQLIAVYHKVLQQMKAVVYIWVRLKGENR
jgi:hypothetical protein